MPQDQPKSKGEYLGDGVYASFDGFQVWLAVNHHANHVVALEPTVMLALIRYWERLEAGRGRTKEQTR